MDRWLLWAERFDSWRVVPRVILFLYCGFVYKVTFYMLIWYTHEPAVARGVEETAFVSAIFTAMSMLAGYVLNIYTNAGRDWNARTTPP